MNPDDHLIDRHLAGILTPEEEARLEHLIRTDPTWAERYRRGEAMSRLLQEALGPSEAPEHVKAMVRRTAGPSAETTAPATRHRGFTRRSWAIAAMMVVGLASAYLILGGGGPGGLQDAEAAVVDRPLKDLARGADVGVIGRVVDRDGQRAFEVERVLFGEPGARAFQVPAGAAVEARYALFGELPAMPGDAIRATDAGVVPLDRPVQWDGRTLAPEGTLAHLARIPSVRSMEACLRDLEAFMASPSLLHSHAPTAPAGADVVSEDALPYRADTTARFLGRFPARSVHAPLMHLLMDRQRHVDVRIAAGEGLMASDPISACREFLRRVLAENPESLRAQSEDGFVVLHTLQRVQQSGPADVADELEILAKAVRCPALQMVAGRAREAVQGDGSREPSPLPAFPHPRRIEVDGQIAVLMAGCDGRRDKITLVFPGRTTLPQAATALNRVVDAGSALVVLPPGASNPGSWLQRAQTEDLIDADAEVHVLALGEGAPAALEACQALEPKRLVVVGKGLRSILTTSPTPAASAALLVEPRGASELTEGPVAGTRWSLLARGADGEGWLEDGDLWDGVLDQGS